VNRRQISNQLKDSSMWILFVISVKKTVVKCGGICVGQHLYALLEAALLAALAALDAAAAAEAARAASGSGSIS